MTSQGVTGEGERPARRRRVEALPFTAEAKALDSRLRGNDEPRRDGRRVNDSLAAGEWKLCSEGNGSPKASGSSARVTRSPQASGSSALKVTPLAISEWKPSF